MRNILLQLIATIILGYLCHQFMPFWAIAVAGFVAGLFFKYKWLLSGFAASFLGGFLLWGGLAWWIDRENAQQLSSMLGELFKTDGAYLPYVTGLVGGLLAGFGALTGGSLRKLFDR
ncbi:MAG: hypothetical protein Kow0027_11030 [Saprospiraceae bacterium]